MKTTKEVMKTSGGSALSSICSSVGNGPEGTPGLGRWRGPSPMLSQVAVRVACYLEDGD